MKAKQTVTIREATMLGDYDTTATIAVNDIELARKFYGGTLGFKEVSAEETGVPSYSSGSSMIRSCESKYASTSKAKTFGWVAGDEIDGLLQTLKGF